MRVRMSRWFLLFLVMSLGLAGCDRAEVSEARPLLTAATADETGLGPEVFPAQVAELVAENRAIVIDVREAWEFEAGSIPAATLIPLGTLSDRLDEVPTDQPVVLVCRVGNRSGEAYRFLSRLGFTNVHNMVGGMVAWEAAGHDVER